MGALSVVICAILSTIFLKERLSFVGKVGCFNCIVGSVVIAVNAPEQSSVARIQDMKKWVIAPGFLSYAGVIIVACVIIAFWLGPKYGKKSMMVYITICSLIGGLSVVATQGLGAAVVAQASGTYGGQFKEWFLYVLLVFVVVTLLTEIIFLNVSRSSSWPMENTKLCLESTKPVQCCIGNTDLLRLLYLCHHCHLGSLVPRFQRYTSPDRHRHHGFPANLFWRCLVATIQISQGRSRLGRLQGRSRPSTDCWRNGRARIRAPSRHTPWRRCYPQITIKGEITQGTQRGPKDPRRTYGAYRRRRASRIRRSPQAENCPGPQPATIPQRHYHTYEDDTPPSRNVTIPHRRL